MEQEQTQQEPLANEENLNPDIDVTVDNESEEPKEESRRERRKREKEEKKQSENDKLQEMGEKLAEMNDKYMRVYSEYENYRKRTNLEKADLILNGGKDVIKSILPIVDDMERALAHMADGAEKEGVQLIFNKLMTTLEQKGLTPIVAKGEKFDENLHEAVTQFPAPTEDLKGKVVDEVEKGYYLNGKVLRYAKVVVGL